MKSPRCFSFFSLEHVNLSFCSDVKSCTPLQNILAGDCQLYEGPYTVVNPYIFVGS